VAVALNGSACIQKETRSVMYLDPDGSVTWSILESDVRSDAATPAERAGEEEGYRREMLANPTPLVAWLDALGGRAITRTVLKYTAPFEAHTVARFDRLDALLVSICQAAGSRCVSDIASDGRRTRMTLEQVGEAGEGTGTDVGTVTDVLDGLRLVLGEGTFVEAVGFTLKDGRTATLSDDLDAEHIRLVLAWDVPGR
jgi:hypothetical protein